MTEPYVLASQEFEHPITIPAALAELEHVHKVLWQVMEEVAQPIHITLPVGR